jgi:hypothetical protein
MVTNGCSSPCLPESVGASRSHVRVNNKTRLVHFHGRETIAWGKRANSGEVHIAFPWHKAWPGKGNELQAHSRLSALLSLSHKVGDWLNQVF